MEKTLKKEKDGALRDPVEYYMRCYMLNILHVNSRSFNTYISLVK